MHTLLQMFGVSQCRLYSGRLNNKTNNNKINEYENI